MQSLDRSTKKNGKISPQVDESSWPIMDQNGTWLNELSPRSPGWFPACEGGQTNRAVPPTVCGGTMPQVLCFCCCQTSASVAPSN